jgi:hypothetical protein
MSLCEKRKRRLTNLLNEHNINIENIISNNGIKPIEFQNLIDSYYKDGNHKDRYKIMRYSKLFLALKNKNLIIRNDSELCNNFINDDYDIINDDNIQEKLENVVNVMCEMNWFYNHSSYKHNLQNIYDSQRRRNNYNNYNHYDRYYSDYDSFYDSDSDSDYEEYYSHNKIDNSERAKYKSLQEWINNDMIEPHPPFSLKNTINKIICEKILEDTTKEINMKNINDYYEDKFRHVKSIKITKEYNKDGILWVNENEIFRVITEALNNYLKKIMPIDVIKKTKERKKENKIPKFVKNIDMFDDELQVKILEIYNKIKDLEFCCNDYCLDYNDICENKKCKSCCKKSKNKCNYHKNNKKINNLDKCMICQKNYYASFCQSKCCGLCCTNNVCKHFIRNKN